MINDMGVFLAELKVEELRRSFTPIVDYDAQTVPEEPGWVSKRAGRLLQTVGRSLTIWGKRVSEESDVALEVPYRREQPSSILG